jgi:DNA invertase Pin-like site-specific DNA recombinase
MKKQTIKTKTINEQFIDAIHTALAQYNSQIVSENIKRRIAQKKLLAKKSK